MVKKAEKTDEQKYIEQLETENLDIVQKVDLLTTENNALKLYCGTMEKQKAEIEEEVEKQINVCRKQEGLIKRMEEIIEQIKRQYSEKDEMIAYMQKTMQKVLEKSTHPAMTIRLDKNGKPIHEWYSEDAWGNNNKDEVVDWTEENLYKDEASDKDKYYKERQSARGKRSKRAMKSGKEYYDKSIIESYDCGDVNDDPAKW